MFLMPIVNGMITVNNKIVIKKTQTDNKQVNDLYNQLSLFAGIANKNPFFQGTLLSDISLTTSFTAFSHLLGTKFSGYIVVKSSVLANVCHDSASTEQNKTLNLKSSVPGTFSIWVY